MSPKSGGAYKLPKQRGPNIVVESTRNFRARQRWLRSVGTISPQKRGAASRKLREAIQRETPVDTGRTRRTMTVNTLQQGKGVVIKITTAAQYAVWIKHKRPRWPQPNLFLQRGFEKALPDLRRLLSPVPVESKPPGVTIVERYGAIIQPTSSTILNKLLRRRQLDYGDAGAMRSRG